MSEPTDVYVSPELAAELRSELKVAEPVTAVHRAFTDGVKAAIDALDQHYHYYAMERPSWIGPIVLEKTGVDVDAEGAADAG